MKELDLEIIEIAKEVEMMGFNTVAKKHNYSKRKLLNILYAATKLSVINNHQKEVFLEILKAQLYQYKFQDKKIGCLADIHLGAKDACMEYVKRAYEEFNKQGIENVFLLGDILEGYIDNVFNTVRSKQKEICQSQLEYFQKEYPKDFQNYYVFGNHEERFKWQGIDLEQIINEKRKDMHPLGVGYGYVNWEDRTIALGHKTTVNKQPIFLTDCDYYIYGHAHFYDYDPKYRALKVPACSKVQPNKNADKKYQPGFIILEEKNENLVAHRYTFDENKPVHAFKRVLKLNQNEKIDK